jgi:hypothetical protein
MTAPIACTLTADDYAERVRSIAELNRAFLRAHRRDGLTLTLTYSPAAAARVRRLVELEGQCCAFLTFRVDETADAVRLAVVAPEEAASGLHAVFSPFLEGVPERPAGAVAKGAAVAALACGVCCVVPLLALPAVGLTAAGGALAAVAVVGWRRSRA